MGPHQGRKAFMLQTLAPRPEERGAEAVAQANGFSLHAGMAAQAGELAKLERLCRYISRPAVAVETAQGHIRYALKTPYRDGTTHVVFEPEDFLSRLAALVPSPWVNLTRFHDVFAPHHELRSQIVACSGDSAEAQAGQGKRGARATSMGWAQRLKRVFAIERCGGGMKIIAAIENAELIEKILRHVAPERALEVQAAPRAPPLFTANLFN
jgi:hypothetical protein